MMTPLLTASLLLFAVMPSTSTYKLEAYGFGNGGTANSTSANYALEGTAGEPNGGVSSSATYMLKPGFTQTQQANIPRLSSFDNSSGIYYNKLHFAIDQQGNDDEALYAIQVSTDNFTSDIRYVKNDLTIGASLTLADYKTHTAWGGAIGSNIVGLASATTYQARVKATQGRFTESAYGPSSSATTASPSITFSLATSSQAVPPFSITYPTLSAGTVSGSSDTINTALDTNAANGANIYVTGKNGGLLSDSTGYKINAVSSNLASLSEGFGAQSTAINQTNGGPFSVLSPYNGSGATVGTLDATTRSLYLTPGPLSGGSASLTLFAKASSTAIAATDYTDVITFIAAGNY